MAEQPIPPNSGGRFVIDADGVRRRVEAPTAPAEIKPRPASAPKPAARTKPAAKE